MARLFRTLVLTLVAVAGLTLAGCQLLAPPPPTAVPTRPATVTPTVTVTPAPTRTLVATPAASTTPRPASTRRPTRTATPTHPPESTRPPTPAPSPLDHTENILVLGVDHRQGDPDPAWRTDTIMVLAIDHQNQQVGIISIPRDLYVEIPDVGEARINQADFYGEATGYPGGGVALLRRVLTETLGIPTQRYVRIQMEGLVGLVDALGGVTVTLDCPLYERVPDESSPSGVTDWTLPAGQVHLDGESAKKFATYRYVTADFGRAHRQQQLVWAIRDRALQLDIVPLIPELWRALAHTFVSDLGLLDIIKLARLGVALRPEQVHGLVFSEDVLDYFITEEGAWVLVVKDWDRLEQEKAQIFAAKPLSSLGKSETGECPPPPTAAPTFTATPTATPAAPTEATPTPGGA